MIYCKARNFRGEQLPGFQNLDWFGAIKFRDITSTKSEVRIKKKWTNLVQASPSEPTPTERPMATGLWCVLLVHGTWIPQHAKLVRRPRGRWPSTLTWWFDGDTFEATKVHVFHHIAKFANINHSQNFLTLQYMCFLFFILFFFCKTRQYSDGHETTAETLSLLIKCLLVAWWKLFSWK